MVAFERLISWANGRTIVVPLSGGFDSRLIVLMLKRLGYARMITFSYGRPGNKESEISREVASALGIQWEFVPYSNAAWRRWSGTEEWRAYCRTSNGLTSVPNIQDWPTIWELQRQELIPQDSVFVPGHTAGHSRHSSHVPIAWLERRTIYEKELLDSIRKTWYTLQDLSRHRELELKLNEKMTRLLMTRRSYTQEGAVADYERWWWQEREAKFTINSVRTYDFWGYEWWLPLWDMDLVKFWSRVPFVQRLEENLHTTHIQDLEMKLLRRNIEQWGTPSVLSVVARLLRKMRIYDHAVRRYELRQYDRHPLAWYGIMTKDEFYGSFTGKETINSYLAAKTLQSTFLDHDLLKGLTKHSDFSTGG